MEFEFDKEMDALLRRARASGEGLAVIDSSGHLDADEIAIFAENALPEKAKPRFIKHLADCDRCRTILSNTIALNSETDEKAASLPVEAPAVEAASVAVPWYKKLFATQNLAYGLGAMVLLFAGMLGFIAVQNSFNSGSEMAKVSEDVARSTNTAAPTPETIDLIEQEIANSNVATNAPETNGDFEDRQTESDAGRASTDGDGKPVNGPRDANENDLKDRRQDPSLTNSRGNKRLDDDAPGQDKLESKADEVAVQESEQNVVVGNSNRAGGGKNRRSANLGSVYKSAPAKPSAAPQVARSTPSSNRPVAEAKKRKEESRERNTEPSIVVSQDSYAAPPIRKLAGKTFTQKNRVWYDSQYKGQKTTNVRRKTAAYNRLDSGLRSIASKLDGTVVVVWKTTAYRID